MTVAMTKLIECLTVIQQPQDMQGLHMGYLRRLILSNGDIIDMLNWLKNNKPELCYDIFYKDLPNLKIKSCEECADSNWDGG